MVRDGSGDFLDAWYSAIGNETKKATAEKDIVEKWLPYFEAILKENGGQYFAGELTYADFEFAEFLDNIIERQYPNALKNYPLLTQLHKNIISRPKIAAYIAKRKPTPW